MFNSSPTTPSDSPKEDLHDAFLANLDLFPDITDPEQREEAIAGFERYLSVINDIFMEHLAEGETGTMAEENSLRDQWQKRF